jgi:signal transduction histidine kinase
MYSEKVKELQEEYGEILKQYVETYDESSLFRISKLAKQFLEEKIGPDEVAEMHSSMLTSLVQGMSREEGIEAIQQGVNPLLELMMGYAIAYQEYLDLHAKEFEELRRRGGSVESERLASVGMLSLGMMGRVTTLLDSIASTYGELAVISGDDSDHKKLLDSLLQQTNEAMGATRTLASYSRRISRDEPAEVDVSALLRESLEVVRRLVSFDSISVAADIRDTPALVTRPGELQELFVSLIANAVDAIQGSGQLTLGSRYEVSKLSRYHVVGIAYKAGDPKTSNIFSLSSAGAATGLDIAKNIIQRVGGELEIKSKGDTTSVILKLSPGVEANR